MSSFACKGILAPNAVSIFSAVMVSILCIMITTGNALIILVIYKDPLKKLRTPFTYFIVNLACADLIVGAVTCPIFTYTLVLETLGSLSEIMAKTYHMTFFISSTASILSLIALSVDRYIAIAFPFKYKYLFTSMRCRAITIVIWILAFSISSVYLKVGYISHLMVFANTAIVIAFVIFIGTYFRVYKFLRDETVRYRQDRDARVTVETMTQEHLKRLKNEKRVTNVFLTVLVVFLCTYCPSAVMIYLLQAFKSWDCTLRHWLRDLVILFVIVNSCVNPFVYTIRLKNFRRSLKLVVFGKKGGLSSLLKYRGDRDSSSTLSMMTVDGYSTRPSRSVVSTAGGHAPYHV